ncbi:hypothetical protein [Dokdonella soli]|uniref:Outer membrane protein assembly factor BamC n=1 Tax=Dokdonella soli TaxID=529810 RepID=A0ABN1IBY6_9GAMM
MRRTPFALLAVLAAGSLLTGCDFMHRHFGHKDAEYRKSVEERPLEVPPDLDTPNSSGALVIPSTSAVSSAASATTTSSAPPASASAAATSSSTQPPALVAPTTAGVALSGGGLHVADTVESTWSRVGLALERSGAATIQGRDEAGRTYTVETTGQTTAEAGWFKRAITLGHAGNKVTAKVGLTVRVSADGAGSKVSIEGATDDASKDAAKSLLETLRKRLS